MLKVIIFTSLLVCVAIVYAKDANEEHHNKHHLQHSKQLEEHQLGADQPQHAKHKKHNKHALTDSEHGAAHHMQHGKVNAAPQGTSRVRKPKREKSKKKVEESRMQRAERKERKHKDEGKIKHSGAGEARTSGHKRKHAKRGHEGQERAAVGKKLEH